MVKGETSLKVRKQAEQEQHKQFEFNPVPRASGPKPKTQAQEERKLDAARKAAMEFANELNRLARLKTRYS